ncbi:sensor histidine kinase [Oceanobacillus sp. CFH 90083]|uniref:sensor histidine kinase n=1 Tax=Oceanobacillus sp. CFH 90083 TaxID=2592336 RepID=UPI00128DEFD4|nr:sensor histidine kinase [Oceanobacillus sp. CFH 90083]
MFELLITLVERVGIIVTIAFVLTRFRFFRKMFYQDQLNRQQNLTAIMFFAFFGIVGTYTGLNVNTDSLQFNRWATDLMTEEAIANSRVIGIVIAGLLGGPKVGIGAAVIAGAHRFTLGGFTAIACGVATMIAGVIASLFYKKNKRIKLRTAFFVGAIAEAVQMLVILALARPVEQAWALVNLIGIPMILANGIGAVLVLLIMKSVLREEEKAGAEQAQKTLKIADQTLAHLRNGLHIGGAEAVCRIIHKELNTSAVSITNKTAILAHIGLGHDHHHRENPIQTKITSETIESGKIQMATSESIHCTNEDCPLEAVMIAPLKERGEIIGTLKFYFQSENDLTNVNMELITGLSSMISHQLEIGQAERVYHLAKEAEIKALQAQIHPHFLFNTLNTIVSLVRLHPVKARKMLISLSHFIRQNLSATTQKITTLEQELKQVQAYLSLYEERFKDRLTVRYEIDEEVLSEMIPPLTLQPIVENAMMHGFKDKDSDCVLEVIIKKQQNGVYIGVKDNGKGIEKKIVDQIRRTPIDSGSGSGLALYNVNRRLNILFGEEALLQVETNKGKGTNIYFVLSDKEEEEQWIS